MSRIAIALVCALSVQIVVAGDSAPAQRSQAPTPPVPPRVPQYYNPSWSADGTRLVYETNSAGRFALFVVRANGSANRPLSDFRANDTDAVWSPDGTRIAFVSDRSGQLDIYVAASDWSAPVNVSDDPGQQYQPAWSQDGRYLAYVTKPTAGGRLHDIVVADVATRTKRVIAAGTTNELSPSFSPDGSRIAFASNRSGTEEIYTMSLDGSDVRALTSNSGSSMPSWSRQGRIVFRSTRTGNSEAYTMAADGTDVMRVTNTGAIETMPSWSPDGTRIAYVSDEDGRTRIMVAAVDGSGSICVEGACNKGYEGAPAFSADGRQVAFVTHRAGAVSDLYVVGVDGSGLRRITTSPTPKSNPSWSPDGRVIVFASRQGQNTAIWRVDVQTGAEQQVSSEPGDQTPAFAPDGSEIALASGPRNSVNLYAIKADGSARRPITTFPSPTLNYWPSWAGDRIVFSSASNPGPGMTLRLGTVGAGGGSVSFVTTTASGPQCASVSRDGRAIAFQARVEASNTDIFVINADGSGERRLTTDPALDETPAWSPDGSLIAFQSDRSGEMRVYVMRADGSGTRRVTR